MPRVFATDIVETSSTLGTATYSLDGPRIGYRSFAEGYDTGDTPYYVVRNAQDTKYEHNRKGLYTQASPDTLTRNVLYSSSGGAPVNWLAADLPLMVYVPSAIELLEQLIRNFMGEVRDQYLEFGHWFDSSIPGKAIWKIWDGGGDVTVGTIDLATHTMVLRDFPAGIVQMYAGGVAPTGFVFCRGQALSRLIYAELYSKIGNQYGGSDANGTFNVPNLQGYVVAGVYASGTPVLDGNVPRSTLGGVWGTQYHQHYVPVGGIYGTVDVNVGGFLQLYGAGMDAADAGDDFQMGSGGSHNVAATSHRHNNVVVQGNGSMSGAGSIRGGTAGGAGTADNRQNLPPTMALNYIISTGGV